MRKVKLHFVNPSHLKTLMANENFKSEIEYLKPQQLDDSNIGLTDPVGLHTVLDSEIVILSKFAKAIKNLIFPDSQDEIEFIVPSLDARKIGLRHKNVTIIDSTDISL